MPTRITPETAAERLQAEPETIYLDVRSTQEFAAGHPPGAFNVPLLEPDPSTGMMMPNPHFVAQVEALFATGQAMIAGCRSGARSLQAATLLERAGYTNVVDMQGGFLGQANEVGMKIAPGWVDCGLEVEIVPLAGRDFSALLDRIQRGG